mmetsp:Transcript_8399/g.23350  ORF Transcript_8399/g.23350 Transcript_8399/m.23350 type:complete len:209 (-) Transcript_8399:2833-3459(-)
MHQAQSTKRAGPLRQERSYRAAALWRCLAGGSSEPSWLSSAYQSPGMLGRLQGHRHSVRDRWPEAPWRHEGSRQGTPPTPQHRTQHRSEAGDHVGCREDTRFLQAGGVRTSEICEAGVADQEHYSHSSLLETQDRKANVQGHPCLHSPRAIFVARQTVSSGLGSASSGGLSNEDSGLRTQTPQPEGLCDNCLQDHANSVMAAGYCWSS